MAPFRFQSQIGGHRCHCCACRARGGPVLETIQSLHQGCHIAEICQKTETKSCYRIQLLLFQKPVQLAGQEIGPPPEVLECEAAAEWANLKPWLNVASHECGIGAVNRNPRRNHPPNSHGIHSRRNSVLVFMRCRQELVNALRELRSSFMNSVDRKRQ